MKDTNLYSLFQLSPVPMWVFEVSTLRFLDVNIAATVSYGYTKKEFLSMTINDIRPEEDTDKVKKIVSENLATGSFYKNVFRHVLKSGRIIYVQVASNLINFEGKTARVVLALDVTEKQEAQEALIMNERRFKALVQDGSDMITVIDEEFRYKYVSPASEKVFGVDPNFFIGKKAFDFIHELDIKRVEQEAMKIWETKSIQLSPYRYRNAGGGWLWIETRATNLFEDPAVKGIVCTSKDISERIEAQKLLEENVERYNVVSKATSDIIWDLNLETNTIVWNKAIKGILKYSVNEMTSFDWWKQHIHPQDKEKVLNRLEDHIAKGLVKWQDEYRFLCGDGSYKYIFDRGFVMLDENDKAFRMIGAMQDITDQKEDEKWSKLLESVVINTTDGVLITDASSPRPLIIYVNEALTAMSGYSREELIGSYPDILHGKGVDQPGLTELKNAVAEKRSVKVELINITKDGRSYYVGLNLTPIFGEDGELIRWISIQRDVSDYRRYLSEIEAQNKRLMDISWMQSHVVRTPLARMMSLTALLEDSNDELERKELLQYLKDSANELDAIIRAIANGTS
jgi:PAS domain S-box-containing protein